MKVEQWIWNMVRVRVKVEYNESETLWIWNTVIVKPNESENCEFESGTQWKLNTMRVKLPTSSSRGLVVPSESQWAAVKNKNQSINQMSSCKRFSGFWLNGNLQSLLCGEGVRAPGQVEDVLPQLHLFITVSHTYIGEGVGYNSHIF